MDYCPGGELSVHLHEAERFSEEVTTFYAAEIVLALEHLHRQGIIYRDLKPENLLLTASGHLKLVDFGISKFGITDATMGATTMCGSYEYLGAHHRRISCILSYKPELTGCLLCSVQLLRCS